MTDNRVTPADSLYRSFPTFSAWGKLSFSDLDLWDRFAASFRERRKAATPETMRAAVDVAIRAAALDTGAIEGLYSVDRGFTMTVALQQLAWEQAIEEKGADVRELFEAQLAAYELVLDAVTHRLPVTEAWIRALHETLCAPQRTYRVLTDMGWQEQELPKGKYKTRPNHVRLSDGTFHAYAPVDQVPSEMHRLLEQIQTPKFETAHPILQATYVHYAFVVIHPFADGNGRVARALASIFFYKAQSIPLVIFVNQRSAYIDVLHMADLGNYGPIFSFFRDRGIDTMQMVSEGLLTAMMKLKETLSEVSRLSSLPNAGEMDDIAHRLLNVVEDSFREQFEELHSSKATLSTHRTEKENKKKSFMTDFLIGPRLSSKLGAYRPVPGKDMTLWIHLAVSSQDGSLVYGSLVYTSVGVFTRKKASHPFAFAIETEYSDDTLEVRLEDVYPELSGAFQLRLAHWIQRQTARLLKHLAEKIRESRG